MGTCYQRYLNVIDNIESSKNSEDEKNLETERAVFAREEAFIKQYKDTAEFTQNSFWAHLPH